MNPNVGQYVKIIFNNGTTSEGIVKYWSDEKSILISENGDSMMIIQKTKNDVLSVVIKLKHKPINQLQVEYEELVDKVEKNNDDIKNLAELRKELIHQEQKDFLETVKTHEMSQIGSVQYALPNISTKPRPFQRSPSQNKRADIRNYSSLSEVFGPKNKNNR